MGNEGRVEPNLTMGDVFEDIWQARRSILGGVLTGLMCAAFFIFFATPFYRAEMVVSPATPMNGAEVSSVGVDNNLSALRYLVQRMGAGNSSDFLRFETLYTGPSVATFLLKDPNILEGLRRDQSSGFLKAKGDWSPEKLSEYLEKRVKMAPVGSSELRKIYYNHPNRDFGVYFLGRIHALTDGLIRTNLKIQAQERVSYLQKAMTQTTNPEHRRALTALLMEQEHLLMLVSIDQPYAASIVEPPSASVKPAWPDKALVFPALTFAGALIGFVLFGFLKALSRIAEQSQVFEEEERGVQEEQARKSRKWYQAEGLNTNRKPPSSKVAG